MNSYRTHYYQPGYDHWNDFNISDRLPSGISFHPPKPAVLEIGNFPRRRHVALASFPHWPTAGKSTPQPHTLRCLPLLNVNVEVNVLSTVSRTTLKQTFLNFADVAIEEAKYSFPLYDGATVFSFRCIIGQDRVLQGEVKPKEEARNEFKKAVSEERVAALLEEQTTEIFEIHLGNIPANTTVEVEIAYALELKADIGGEGVLLTIPTSIAPRYGTPPSDYRPDSSVDVSGAGLNITIDVAVPTAIRKIESRTHPISVEMGLDEPTQVPDFSDIANPPAADANPFQKARATLSDKTTQLGRDFVILILCAGSDLLKSQALLEAGSGNGQSAMMVTIAPRTLFSSHISPTRDFDGEIIFVIDCSGSMEGSKLQTAKEALRISLRSLSERCFFNVFAFGSHHSSLWKTSAPYSQNSLDEALKFISDLGNMGGTELLAAVRGAVQSRKSVNGGSSQVILLTDGEIWETEEAIGFAKSTCEESIHKTRFFALGIGESVSHRLIEGIGQVGGGFGEVVAANRQGNWQRRVIGLLKGAFMPETWNCSLELDGPLPSPPTENDAHDREWKIQAPDRIPPIHSFARLSVFFLLHTKAAKALKTIAVKTLTPSGDEISVPISLQRSEMPGHVLRHLSAKAAIKDLEFGQSSLHWSKDQDTSHQCSDAMLKHEAERLGGLYNIASKWTSFVATEREPGLSRAIQVYKAQKLEVTNLMKPMSAPSPTAHLAGIPRGKRGSISGSSRTASGFAPLPRPYCSTDSHDYNISRRDRSSRSAFASVSGSDAGSVSSVDTSPTSPGPASMPVEDEQVVAENRGRPSSEFSQDDGWSRNNTLARDVKSQTSQKREKNKEQRSRSRSRSRPRSNSRNVYEHQEESSNNDNTPQGAPIPGPNTSKRFFKLVPRMTASPSKLKPLPASSSTPVEFARAHEVSWTGNASSTSALSSTPSPVYGLQCDEEVEPAGPSMGSSDWYSPPASPATELLLPNLQWDNSFSNGRSNSREVRMQCMDTSWSKFRAPPPAGPSCGGNNWSFQSERVLDASNLMDVVDAQSASGSFSTTPEYLECLSHKFKPSTQRSISSLLREPSNLPDSSHYLSDEMIDLITSTILSVALLKANFESEKELWEMMVEKAERWLTQQISDELLGKLWQLVENALAKQGLERKGLE